MMSSWKDQRRTPALRSPDPLFRYRFDRLSSLRKLKSHFSPRRWKQGDWAHKSLIDAANSMREARALFRISFWLNEDTACREAVVLSSEPHLLLRVRVAALQAAFAGWHFEEDDHLRGKADLIWNELPVDRDSDGFLDSGIPLSDLEVWTPSGWINWHFAEPLLPLHERMARLGWTQTFYQDAWGGPGACFWKLLRHPISPSKLCALVVQDTDLGGATMVSDDLVVKAITLSIVERHPATRELLKTVTLIDTLVGVSAPLFSQDWAVEWDASEVDDRPRWLRILPRILSTPPVSAGPVVTCKPQLRGHVPRLAIAAGLHRTYICEATTWLDHAQYR